MSPIDLATLKAVAQRHLDVHGRLPREMAEKLIAAIEQLERALNSRAAA